MTTKRLTSVLSFIGKDVIIRNFGRSSLLTQVQAAVDVKHCAEWENAHPYEDIPGPKPFPKRKGILWQFLPFGKYWGMGHDRVFEQLFAEYGKIVKLSGIGPKDMVVLFSPEDVEKLFRNESVMPIRRGLSSVAYYKNVMRKEMFGGTTGLVSSEGQEWYDFRKIVNQPMIQPRSVKMYIKPVENVADCFIERMKRIRDEYMEMPKDFLQEINKWALESVGVIALDTSFGCLEDGIEENSEAVRMIKAIRNMFDYMFILETTHSPWRYIWTPTWGKFVKVMDVACEIFLSHIHKKWEVIKKTGPKAGGNSSILEDILLRSDNYNIAFTMATDMMFAGIDTTSNVLASALYFISKNEDKQEKLFKELKTLLPDKKHSLSENVLNEAKYLKACIKETNRMSPTAIGTQRETVKDLVFSNYRVPKGTAILSNNMVMCQQKENFKEPHRFIPERWLKDDSEYSLKATNPFVYLPFGFGPRSCIGRRFAELELHVMLAKIVRNFKISYHYGEMTWQSKLLRTPNKPLAFKMLDRKE